MEGRFGHKINKNLHGQSSRTDLSEVKKCTPSRRFPDKLISRKPLVPRYERVMRLYELGILRNGPPFAQRWVAGSGGGASIWVPVASYDDGSELVKAGSSSRPADVSTGDAFF